MQTATPHRSHKLKGIVLIVRDRIGQKRHRKTSERESERRENEQKCSPLFPLGQSVCLVPLDWKNWNDAVIATESILKRYLVLPQFAEAVPNGKVIQKFLETKGVSQSLQFCNNLSRFLRETRKTLVDEGVLVLQDVASGANGLGTAHQEAPPIAAQAAPATVDYGTFPSTTSHHPKTPVRSFPSPPQSKEEKWADAVEFTASEMNDNPYCKYFPQCFFNPDGPKHTLPQIVNPVPFPSVIRDFLKDKDKEFCEKLYSRLNTQQ
ncbi:hypothetical protein CAEBREN_07840 [Caenorhabditis brenneri]|uniref:Uncharacterized protein n=1 Tax=Caenorhabditis brenneri TaxID=135651 RepID=G0NX12_CAEBE|nr:hypothetical protein CAEBREN_07840 [Caenorhabditis brenneri]